MSSDENNQSFWTQTSGIVTIVGLVVGTILTAIALCFAVLSYRQMNQVLRMPIPIPKPQPMEQPPPPYCLTPSPPSPEQEREIKKKLNARNDDDDDDAYPLPPREIRKRKLGRRRWCVLLFLVTIILAAGVIALACNLSRIRSLKYVQMPCLRGALLNLNSKASDASSLNAVLPAAVSTSMTSMTSTTTAPASAPTTATATQSQSMYQFFHSPYIICYYNILVLVDVCFASCQKSFAWNETSNTIRP